MFGMNKNTHNCHEALLTDQLEIWKTAAERAWQENRDLRKAAKPPTPIIHHGVKEGRTGGITFPNGIRYSPFPLNVDYYGGRDEGYRSGKVGPYTADSILARDLATARKDRDAARKNLRDQQEWTLAQNTVITQAQQKNAQLQSAVNALNGLIDDLQTRNAQLREQGHMDAQTINRLEARTSSTFEVEANVALRKENDQLRTRVSEAVGLNAKLRQELSDWRSGRSFFSGPTPPKITNNTFGRPGYCACPGCSKYGTLPGHG